jgi:plasmid stabilization system protein ParE
VKVDLSADAERDLTGLYVFLVETHLGFGHSYDEAAGKAGDRVFSIRRASDRIGLAPRRGTRHDQILPGLRNVTIDRAIYWFTVDEAAEVVSVLGIFYGGQDHHRSMLRRLLEAR